MIIRRRFIYGSLASSAAAATPSFLGRAQANAPTPGKVTLFPVEAGSGSRDVACLADGTVLYCGQRNGTLGRLDPRDGSVKVVKLGEGAAPHGVVIGPDGAAWITEGGQNAIARVDPADHKVMLWKLPRAGYANLNTGVFDKDGTFWFTGQSGIHGRFVPKTEKMEVFDSPRGAGPYGITLTPSGEVWFVSLAGNYLARIDRETGAATVLEPPTPNQGARRVWSDSKGRLWISEWNSGNLSMHDPASGAWKVWKLPGQRPRCYAVYVDERDIVWATDFAANAIVRFDPATETFTSVPADKPGANVRQVAGRSGEVWGGETGTNRLIRISTAATT